VLVFFGQRINCAAGMTSNGRRRRSAAPIFL
jgi:hypothetical protein